MPLVIITSPVHAGARGLLQPSATPLEVPLALGFDLVGRQAARWVEPPDLDANPDPVAVAEAESSDSWFTSANLGLFVHYTYGGAGNPQTVYSNGNPTASVNELANAFDAAKFAATCAALKMQYVVFTVWHFGIHVLYPSAVMNSYMPNHASTRDVIADLLDALRPYGIRLVLYIHPLDGKDMTAPEQALVGWNDATNNYAAWNTFTNALITECGLRYGSGVEGFYLDSVESAEWLARFPTVAQNNALRASALSGHPGRVLMGIAGLRDWGLRQKQVLGPRVREYNPAPAQITDWIGSETALSALVVTNGAWWAISPDNVNVFRFTSQDWFRYYVLKTGCNDPGQGGGLQVSCGVYAGSPPSVFEGGVEAGLAGLAALIDAVSESLRGVVQSTCYPRPWDATLATLGTPGYVGTQSRDGQFEYVHVLTPPGGSLTLPVPADRSTLSAPVNLRSGRALSMTRSAAGEYILTLHPLDAWSAVHNCIKLKRSAAALEFESAEKETLFVPATSFTGNAGATLQVQGGENRFPAWLLASATTQSIQCALVVPSGWRGFYVDLQLAKQAAGTNSVGLSVVVLQCLPGDSMGVGDTSVIPSDSIELSAAIGQLRVFSSELVRRVPGALTHLRIQRVGDAGAPVNIMGVVLRRVR